MKERAIPMDDKMSDVFEVEWLKVVHMPFVIYKNKGRRRYGFSYYHRDTQKAGGLEGWG